jgi:hypothetical protein
MGIFNEFNKKEKPLFTGLHFGFGSSGGGAAAEAFSATGGAKMETGGYVYHLFYDGLTSDNFVVNSGSTLITYVVVGGGGGGGNGLTGNNSNHHAGGGGGAGGYRTGTSTVSSGTYPVTCGTGGAGNDAPRSGPTPGFGAKGNDSTLGLSTPVVGSGGGAGENRSARNNGGKADVSPVMHGGSGGGAASSPTSNRPVGITLDSPDGISPLTQGYNGGRQSGDGSASGGGGGAGGVGQNAPADTTGGNGGNGAPTVFPGPGLYPLLPSPFSNGLGNAWKNALTANGLVGGGGGGGTSGSSDSAADSGHAGPGGGGAGGGNPPGPGNNGTGPGDDAVDGTGGGGGGGASYSFGNGSGDGGDGAPGCIMIRYSA